MVANDTIDIFKCLHGAVVENRIHAEFLASAHNF